MTDPNQIAAGLSEAQRRALKAAQRAYIPTSEKHCRIEWNLLVYRDGGALVGSLRKLGLVKDGTMRLNATGLAVRAIIEAEEPST